MKRPPYGAEVAAELSTRNVDPEWLDRMLAIALQVAARHGVPCPYAPEYGIQCTGEIYMTLPVDVSHDEAAMLGIEFAIEMYTLIPDFPAEHIAADITRRRRDD